MRRCYFCQQNIKEIDYKEKELLEKFLTPLFKIAPSKRTGVCAKHQRKLARAIKRARIMGLLPFVSK